jgi:hypothetical protein
MPASVGLATWLLEQESAALLRRLDRVQPFALQETMVPAAGLMPAAQIAIERHLMKGRQSLREAVTEFRRWLRAEGGSTSPAEQQRRFTIMRLRFQITLDQLDMYSDAITQRSEAETGVWLSGLDVAAQDALSPGKPYYDPPPVVCYLDRGFGGAIRRARTRLPGGGQSPTAIIRIPRERMVGFGIASSLVHEVGHQAAALLRLVESLRPMLQRRRAAGPPAERVSWTYWERTLSEVIADFWAVARVGIASTLGLIAIVSLPKAFVFRVALDDPHPFPWIRVALSCAIGQRLYPHPQWGQLANVWSQLYPSSDVEPARRAIIDGLLATMPSYVDVIAGHRPATLRGRTIGELIVSPERTPAELSRSIQKWAGRQGLIEQAPPTLAFAALARARVTGALDPGAEDELLGRLIRHWALESTLEQAAAAAKGVAIAGPRQSLPSPAMVARSLAPVPLTQ